MSHDRDAWIQQLSELALFSDCKHRDFDEIMALSTDIEMPAGTVLCQEGQPGYEAFVVLDGTAAVTIAGDEVNTIGAGGVVGEIALLDDGPRVATVTALTDIRVLALTRREFNALLADVPAVTRRMLAATATKLRSAGTPRRPAELSV